MKPSFENRNHGRLGCDGFSLVEMLAALVIVGLIASSMLLIRNTSIREARVATNTRTAWRLAQQKYNELQRVPPSTLIPSSGTFQDHEAYRWQTRVRESILQAGRSPEKYENPSEEREKRRYYRVLLTVTYPGSTPGEREQIQLSMIRLPSDTRQDTRQSSDEQQNPEDTDNRSDEQRDPENTDNRSDEPQAPGRTSGTPQNIGQGERR